MCDGQARRARGCGVAVGRGARLHLNLATQHQFDDMLLNPRFDGQIADRRAIAQHGGTVAKH